MLLFLEKSLLRNTELVRLVGLGGFLDQRNLELLKILLQNYQVMLFGKFLREKEENRSGFRAKCLARLENVLKEQAMLEEDLDYLILEYLFTVNIYFEDDSLMHESTVVFERLALLKMRQIQAKHQLDGGVITSLEEFRFDWDLFMREDRCLSLLVPTLRMSFALMALLNSFDQKVCQKIRDQ